MTDTLDFAVLGAQKCGTSALTVLLGEHPGLAVPQQTARFFDNPRFDRGLAWLLETFFAAVPQQVRRGTVGPSYMTGDVETTAERMHRTVPAARLVAVLRDPVERTRSHYAMVSRRGNVLVPFEKAIGGDGEDGLVANGLYGRALAPFLQRFDREQLLILTSEELLRQPKQTLARRLRTSESTQTSCRPASVAPCTRAGQNPVSLLMLLGP